MSREEAITRDVLHLVTIYGLGGVSGTQNFAIGQNKRTQMQKSPKLIDLATRLSRKVRSFSKNKSSLKYLL